MTAFDQAFAGGRPVLLGVVHLEALPGSPRFTGRDRVLARAVADAEALIEGGLDGFVIENFGDAPFHKKDVPPGTIAEMSVLAQRLRQAVGQDALVGINVLRNDARAALAIAAATGAAFIRVNVHTGVMFADQGTLEGAADRTLRERRELSANVAIVADVGVKHALPPAGFDLAQAARDTAYRGLADALIVTGRGTGAEIDFADLECVRRAVPDRPLLVGSGVTASSIGAVLRSARGVIVGTALKRDGDVEQPVSLDRVRELVARSRG